MNSKQITVLFAVVSVFISCKVVAMGSLESEQAATDELRQIVKNAHELIERFANEEYKSIQPISFRRQLVSGYNYFIKAAATSKDDKLSHIHLRIHQNFNDDLRVSAVKKDQDQSKPIEYFQ